MAKQKKAEPKNDLGLTGLVSELHEQIQEAHEWVTGVTIGTAEVKKIRKHIEKALSLIEGWN